MTVSKLPLWRMIRWSVLYLVAKSSVTTVALDLTPSMTRAQFFPRFSAFTLGMFLPTGSALSVPVSSPTHAGWVASHPMAEPVPGLMRPYVAGYQSRSLPMSDFGVSVPVACWFPVNPEELDQPLFDQASYQHKISVRRIGKLLAEWDFIPGQVSRRFDLLATSSSVKAAHSLQLPKAAPVVLLAHGFLGSRFDLSHLAEELAKEGFLCIAPEYPESLAASYDVVPGLDRAVINQRLLDNLSNDWGIRPTSMGIVGHSMGCGTVIDTGDDTWARVCIAGFARLRDGRSIPRNLLLLTSMNDGAVSLARFGGKEMIPNDYALLDQRLFSNPDWNRTPLPRKAAVVFDGPDAPNHISFLAEGVNDAMIDLLSPLLPVAQAFQIPVLDFDRYQLSRDSQATAAMIHPLVIQYLKQEMLR